MELATLQDLFVEELKDLYSAEKQITVALPKMIKAANAPELKAALEEHLKQTEEHMKRLEQIQAAFLGILPEVQIQQDKIKFPAERFAHRLGRIGRDNDVKVFAAQRVCEGLADRSVVIHN